MPKPGQYYLPAGAEGKDLSANRGVRDGEVSIPDDGGGVGGEERYERGREKGREMLGC